MLKWLFCAFPPLLPSGFHIYPVRKIAFKDFPLTQTHRPSQPAFLQQLRDLALHITSTQPLGLVWFPATDHFNLFKAEQWTLHRPHYTESLSRKWLAKQTFISCFAFYNFTFQLNLAFILLILFTDTKINAPNQWSLFDLMCFVRHYKNVHLNLSYKRYLS